MKKKKKKSNTINNKKKKLIIIIIIVIIAITILSSITVSKNKLTKDEKLFKIEYENLNGEKDYIKVKIKDDNGVKYLNGKNTIKFMKNGTGIIYFGFPQCNWCRSAVEVLIDAKDEMEIGEIYYYNAYGARDEKYLDEEGNIITFHSGSDDYYQVLKLLGDKAEVYEGLNDDSIKRLYFPTVAFIKNGKVVDIHVSTVDSNMNKNKKLSKSEYNELKKIYIEKIKKIK